MANDKFCQKEESAFDQIKLNSSNAKKRWLNSKTFKHVCQTISILMINIIYSIFQSPRKKNDSKLSNCLSLSSSSRERERGRKKKIYILIGGGAGEDKGGWGESNIKGKRTDFIMGDLIINFPWVGFLSKYIHLTPFCLIK